MQIETNNGIQESTKEFKEDSISRLDQASTTVEHFAARIEQGENQHKQEMKNIQDQIDSIKRTSPTTALATDQSSARSEEHNAMVQAKKQGPTTQIQNHNLVRMALDKEIDEFKPYFGQKTRERSKCGLRRSINWLKLQECQTTRSLCWHD